MTDTYDNEFIKKIIKTNGIFVSVGCGMGVLEKQLRDAKKIVICVDPNNYDKKDKYLVDVKRVLMPDYKYVSDLILDKPNIVHKVNLILAHPLPDYTMYDIMSVLKLEPTNIFLYYMKGGGAGSWLLHRFLRKNGVNTSGKLLTDADIEKKLNIPSYVCPIKYRYTQIYEKDEIVDKNGRPHQFQHTYSILERKEQLDFVYKPDKDENETTRAGLYSLEDKEEVVLQQNNIKKDFYNCLGYLTHLNLARI
jgi:hypothetical protein